MPVSSYTGSLSDCIGMSPCPAICMVPSPYDSITPDISSGFICIFLTLEPLISISQTPVKFSSMVPFALYRSPSHMKISLPSSFDTIYAFSYTISFVTALACFTSVPFSFCTITIAKTITTHTMVIASIIQTI